MTIKELCELIIILVKTILFTDPMSSTTFRQNYPFQIVNGATTGGNVPLGSGFDNPFRTQFGSFSWLHNFNPQIVNEFIFGSNRSASLNSVPHDTTAPSALGFTNVNPDDPAGAAPPVLQTSSFNLGPSPQGPTKIHDVTFHCQDSVSLSIMGSMTLNLVLI